MSEIHKCPQRPKRKSLKLEEIDAKNLTIFECDVIDKSEPYFEVICEFAIYRAQTLTNACSSWAYDKQRLLAPNEKFNILTISSIIWVDGQETSFSIN